MNFTFFRQSPAVAEAEQSSPEAGTQELTAPPASSADHPAPSVGDLSWEEQVRYTARQLKQISSSTEGEFLAIGEQLQGFYQRASEITTYVSTLVNQLGGEKSVAAMAGLSRMVDLLQGNLDHGGQSRGLEALRTILERLHQVTAPLTGFGQMNKMLGMFGMYTKIESAPLGNRAVGFKSLAQGVTKLSGDVSSKADTVLTRKDELTAVIQDALTTAVSMGAEQQTKTRALLEKTRESLGLLTSIVDRCSLSAATISSSAREVTEDLGEVVVSLQAHDTVRQQIEHVAEALEELAERMPHSGRHPLMGADLSSDVVVETGTLCQIQAEQLRHASTELMTAVESIISHLRDIAIKESAMANGTGELVGVTDQAGSSFFTEMGQDLEEVLATLTATVATNRQLSAVMTRAAETVSGIFRFVDDIETIAYDIKLMALNFLIQASALGREGSGLGVLADAIRRLSDDARMQAEGVTGILTEVKAVTDEMCQDAIAESSGMENTVTEMRQGVEEMLASLQEMSGGVGLGLTAANTLSQELSADIESVTTGITVHRRVAECLADSGATLDAIVGAAKAMTPEAQWAEMSQRLRAEDNRYTMHSERNIHASVVNALAIGAGEFDEFGGADEEQTISAMDEGERQAMDVPLRETPPSAGDDLGDNVELF